MIFAGDEGIEVGKATEEAKIGGEKEECNSTSSCGWISYHDI